MRTCPSCGGVIGRDCFNPEECAWIGEQQERQATRETQTRLAALERKMITPDPRNSVEVNEVLLNELNDCKDRIDVMRDERDAISKRLTEAQLHEVETHDELGAIIGNDDSLAECARRVVRERDEAKTLEIYLKRDQDILRKQLDEAKRLLATRVEASRLDEVVMSTYRQAHCINQCAAHIGPDTSATIDGLPLAVKRVVAERDKAEKLRDEWCAEYTKARDALRAIFEATDPYSDGAPDASPHDLLCNQIAAIVFEALGRDGVDARNDEQRGQDEDWHNTEHQEFRV